MNKNLAYKIGGGLLIAGIAYFGYKKVRAEQQSKAAIKAINTGGNKALGINIPDIAKQIGIELGYAYPVWNIFQYATENDTAAKMLVLKVPKPYIPQLVAAYKKQYPGRDLETDLRKKLDDWNDVKYLFVNEG